MTSRHVLVCALLLSVAGCGFSNAMYNARRRVDDGERAARRGEAIAARAAWVEAIDKAAGAFRSDPDGRHAAEALFLVGRARYGLGEFAAASAALRRSIELAGEGERASAARAYLGAAELQLGRRLVAEATLDSALAGLDDRELVARARLWRGRARAANGRPGVWEDLAHAMDAGGDVARDARFDAAALAVARGDSARAADAFRRILEDGAAARPDTLAALVRGAADRWGAAAASALLDLENSAWPAADRNALLLVRAELLAVDGDTAAAIRVALDAADQLPTSQANDARVRAARWHLRTVPDAGALADVRTMLLPAVASADAQHLLERVRVIDALLEAAESPDRSLALFAAAELARDDLDAPVLARALFLAYAQAAPAALWAPKALLAAAALGEAGDGLRRSLADAHDNVYVATIRGDAGHGGFPDAEERLARALADLRRDAVVAAGGRDPTVGRAVAVIDSLRERERSDSMRVRCSAFIESVAATGIRADSVRAACMRRDSARVAAVLRLDTLALRDSIGPGGRRPIIDTIRAPRP